MIKPRFPKKQFSSKPPFKKRFPSRNAGPNDYNAPSSAAPSTSNPAQPNGQPARQPFKKFNEGQRRPYGARPQGKTFPPRPSYSGKPAYASKPTFGSKPTQANKPASMIKPAGPSPIPKRAPGEFPMRINKYLSWKGFATRRGADDLIQKRKVTINGRFAQLGDQVQATDAIEVRKTGKAETYEYYAYYKPRGISTDPTRKGTPDISSSINLKGVFPVGGLDTNAEGLVILTNDRRIVDRLLNPAHAHHKEYFIRTLGPLRANFREKMGDGVAVLDTNLFSLQVNGSDNDIRERCARFFAEIDTMKRTRILNISLGRMPANTYRTIEGDELASFLRSLGL